jgi:hypothetical protein
MHLMGSKPEGEFAAISHVNIACGANVEVELQDGNSAEENDLFRPWSRGSDWSWWSGAKFVWFVDYYPAVCGCVGLNVCKQTYDCHVIVSGIFGIDNLKI